MGVVNNEIRIAGLEASTAGIMTSVKAIEATTAGLMTSVKSASDAAAAAQGAVETLSGTVGGLVTDETKYNSTIQKYIEGYETSKTGAEIFDMILGELYDNAGADTDYINILQLQVSVTAVGGQYTYNIMDNAKSNVVPKRCVNPAGTPPFDYLLKITGWDSGYSKQCYMERTRNGGRVWECANIPNITSTSFSEFYVYLFYELKKPYSVATN